MPDKKKTMSLKEFLLKTGMPKVEFARRAGFSERTMYRLLEGDNVTIDIIHAIEEVTEGQVTYNEILTTYLEKSARSPSNKKSKRN